MAPVNLPEVLRQALRLGGSTAPPPKTPPPKPPQDELAVMGLLTALSESLVPINMLDSIWGLNGTHEWMPPVVQREASKDALYARYQGYGAMYEHLEKDAHLAAVIERRADEPTQRPRVYRPPNNSALAKAQATFVTEVIEGMGIESSIGDEPSELTATQVFRAGKIQSLAFGFGVHEKVWERRPDGKLSIRKMVGRYPHQFVFDRVGNLRVLTSEERTLGEPIHPWRYFLQRDEMPFGNPYGRALTSELFYLTRAKGLASRDWSFFNNRFGIPFLLLLARANMHMSEQEQRTLVRRASQDLRGGNVAALSGTDMEFLAPPTGTGENFERFIRYVEGEQDKRVLGAAGLLSGEGNRSGLDIAKEGLSAHLASDCALLKRDIYHQLVKPLIDANWPAGSRFYPEVVIRGADSRGLEMELKTMRTLFAELGLAADTDQISELTGYRFPEPDDPNYHLVPAKGAGAATGEGEEGEAPGDQGVAGPTPRVSDVEAAGSRRAFNNGSRPFAANRG